MESCDDLLHLVCCQRILMETVSEDSFLVDRYVYRPDIFFESYELDRFVFIVDKPYEIESDYRMPIYLSQGEIKGNLFSGINVGVHLAIILENFQVLCLI